MSTRFSKAAAMASVCALTLTCFYGCAENDSKETSGVHRQDNYRNNNSIVSAPTVEYDNSDECDDWENSELPSSNEEYKEYIETGFKDPKLEPLSTFSVDVDTASYSNVRRLLENGNIVPEDAVRAEEFINYFDYDYPDPLEGRTFGDYVEIADCPWNSSNKLIMIGIQGKRLEKEEIPPSNLVFLIDSSGSMSARDKLPLVQTAFSMLAEQLTENDRISIVTYAGDASTRLSGASGKDKKKILDTLYDITASGSTNGEGGIERAYQLAEKYFIEGGNNRVILATDGDLNVGASSEEELTELIKTKRDNGIYLSVLGFGTGNYKDSRLEAVADNGNGNYSYIDSVEEAHRVLVKEMVGTMYTIAKDVKIQVEFNPSRINSYRLIGYDNRLINAEDFYDETKDAGEVGAGHSVTALYEVELADMGNSYHGVQLEFASEHEKAPADDSRSELCKLSIAYKPVDLNEDVYESQLFGMEKYNSSPSDSMKLASAAAEFAMLLRNSQYKGSSDFEHLIDVVRSIQNDEKTAELLMLAKTAEGIYR